MIRPDHALGPVEMPQADRPISPRPSAVPPRPTNRRLFVAALGAVLLALAVGAAYHLVEARTATGRTAVGLRMGLANPARDLGLIELAAQLRGGVGP